MINNATLVQIFSTYLDNLPNFTAIFGSKDPNLIIGKGGGGGFWRTVSRLWRRLQANGLTILGD